MPPDSPFLSRLPSAYSVRYATLISPAYQDSGYPLDRRSWSVIRGRVVPRATKTCQTEIAQAFFDVLAEQVRPRLTATYRSQGTSKSALMISRQSADSIRCPRPSRRTTGRMYGCNLDLFQPERRKALGNGGRPCMRSFPAAASENSRQSRGNPPLHMQ